MGDRPDMRDIRISIRTTRDTKYRIAKAAAHYDLSISSFMKLIVVDYMKEHDLWTLAGRVKRRKPYMGRGTKTKIHRTEDPDKR